ncbi:MAG: hypothetical protein WC985_11305 [Thermoplasmata archaeon]
MTFQEIRRELYIPPGSFYRLARTLERIGWIRIIGGVGALHYISAVKGVFPEYPKSCPQCGTILYSFRA